MNSNEEISKKEVALFIKNRPAKYFLYINAKQRTAETWMGDKLGDVVFGTEYRSNFRDTRVAIRIRAINGKTYAGTYFKSSGDNARIREVKA